MSQIFASKRANLFVGGRGTKAGESDCGGGCTESFWEANEDLSLIMGANGDCLNAAGTWNGSQTACTTQNEGGNLRVNYTNGFSNCVAGLLAYIEISFDPNYLSYTDKRYEVLTVDDDYIVIDLPYTSTSPTCDIKVGGAFQNMVTAINVVISPVYNIIIYDNKDETLSGTISPISCGVVGDDVHVTVWGFKTYVGDCDKGGPCYQNSLDAYAVGIDTDSKVNIDANDGAFDILTLDDKDSLEFRNIHFFNNSGTYDAVKFLNSPFDITFINCAFNDVDEYFGGDQTGGFYCIDCYFGGARDTTPSIPGAVNSYFLRCVFDGTGMTYAWGAGYEIYIDCLFLGGQYGIFPTYYIGLYNCVFYGQTTACIYLNYGMSLVYGYNNAFCPIAISDYAVEIGASGGSISLTLECSCVYSIGNGPLTAMVNNVKTSKTYALPGTVIQEEPLFRSAATNDFRLKAESPLLNAGVWTLGGII